jgi:hypothetical protein
VDPRRTTSGSLTGTVIRSDGNERGGLVLVIGSAMRCRLATRVYRTSPSAIISNATASSISANPSCSLFGPLRDSQAVICVTHLW